MRLTLLCVGAARGILVDAIREFEVRVSRYFDIDQLEVAAGKGSGERVKEAEGILLLKRLPKGSRIFALARGGSRYTSAKLADELAEIATYGPSKATFVIGGAFGLDARVLDAADRTLSLSDMTMPHDLARLVLLEQLYRAGTILRGEPYHKGG